MGYRTVALSSSESKKKFATELGATDYIFGDDSAEQLKKLGGADLVVVTAPNPKVVIPLPFACAPMGKVLILSRRFSSDTCQQSKELT
jgi:D-arabinose 1-dehydrogenase-like Zn-dependent alcohol dehydrogenase